MREKVIKISNLCDVRELNGDMNLNMYFNLASKESEEYLLKKNKRKKIIRKVGFFTCCVSLGVITSIMLPPAKAYADSLQFKTLLVESPDLLDKVTQISKMYMEYIGKADMPHSINLFMDMACTCLDGTDKEVFVQATRGIDIFEILHLIFL